MTPDLPKSPRTAHPGRAAHRMVPPASLLGLVLLGAAGCGGGGGGGGGPVDGTPPSLVSATVISSGGSPAPGDTIQLVLSEAVQLAGDNVLTDGSFALSSGTSLGDVSGSASISNGRVVSIVLGAGANINPGSSTITFRTGAEVLDLAGNAVTADTPRAITAGDADPPTVDSLSLNSVDSVLNGTGAAGGTLQVPSNGFIINLTFSDTSSDIDASATSLTANQVVTVDGVGRVAGTNLAPFFSRTDNGSPPTGSDFVVPSNVTFPTTEIILTAQVTDTSGRTSNEERFTFLARPINESVRTFQVAVNPSQLWFLDMTRDLEQFNVDLGNMVTPVEVTQTPNGRSDFEDLLEVLGIYSTTPIANVAGSADSNEVALALFRQALSDQLNALWAGANITFTFTSPGSFPGGASFAFYNDLGFSSVAIAGSADADGTSGILGVALFDPGNHYQDNNADEDFSGQRLGIFFHTIANAGFQSVPSSTYRQTFDPFTSSLGGTPIGDAGDGQDGMRLLGGVGDARETAMTLAISRLARFIAVILAHECGHSMGLVANGAMPVGLYGNMPAQFPGSNNGHITLSDSIFPGVALNIMSPVIGLDAALSSGTDYSTLNRAYLREQVLIND